MAAVAPNARATGVERLATDSRDCAAGLYERHSRGIFRYCLSRLRNPQEAEDAVQTTFLNAQRALARGVVPIAESAWLLKIAHNVCRSHWRERGRRLRFEDSRDPQALEESLPGGARGYDELLGLEQALESLPTQQQRAILLREWQGLSYREIAAELDLSQAAVETLIFRARRALAAGLRGEPKTERRGLARALDVGSLLSALKSALAGLSGAKAAALVAALIAGGVAAGVVALTPEGSDRAAPAQVEQPDRVTLSAPVEGHGNASALEEKIALHEQAAVQEAEATPAASRDGSAPPDADGVAKTLDETTGAVLGAVEDAAAPVLGAVEDAAAPVLSTVTGATTELTETVEGAVDSLPEPPALPDAGDLGSAVGSALDDAVSTLP